MTDFAAEHWAKIYKAEGRPAPSFVDYKEWERAYTEDAEIEDDIQFNTGDRVVMGEAEFIKRETVTVGSAAERAAKILDDRDDKYNNREQTVAKVTAGLWSAFLGVQISPADANLMMAQHKMARTRVDKDRDHYDDGCGYMSMALYAEKMIQ